MTGYRGKWIAGVVLGAGIVMTATPAEATSIVLSSGTFAQPSLTAGSAHSTGTNLTWNYTGNYSDPRYMAYVSTWGAPTLTPFHSTIMFGGAATSNTAYGPDVTGGTPAYTGVEFYYVTFTLPVGATNVALAFTRPTADDRAQVQLNGNVLGYWGGSGGVGQMTGLGSQPSVTNVLFNAAFANAPNVTNQAFFNVGGTNVIRFWVNNTNSTSVGASAIPHSTFDPSTLDFRATLTFTDPPVPAPVPEAGTLTLLGTGLAGLAYRLRHGRRARRG